MKSSEYKSEVLKTLEPNLADNEDDNNNLKNYCWRPEEGDNDGQDEYLAVCLLLIIRGNKKLSYILISINCNRFAINLW